MANALVLPILAGIACAMIAISVSANPAGALALGLFLPLPLLIVGFGFGYMAAAIALIVATLAAFAFTDTKIASMVVFNGLPTIIIAYYALLHRDPPAQNVPAQASGQAATAATDWYPAGYLLAIIAILSGVIAALTFYSFGGTQALVDQVAPTLKRIMQASFEARNTPITEDQIDALTKTLASSLPYTYGAAMTINLALNVYLAGRLTRASGWLTRPWPDLSMIRMPQIISVIFIVLLAITVFGTGEIRGYAAGFTGALFLAYAIVGLGVMHHITKPMRLRFLALSALYLGLLYLNIFVVPLLIVLALADNTFRIRERVSASQPRPPSS